MPREASIRDSVSQFRDDNLKLVLSPQAYVMLEDKERDARADARLAMLLTIVFLALFLASLAPQPWLVLGWPDWCRVAAFLASIIGVPAALGTWRDARAEIAEVQTEVRTLDGFLKAYDRDPEAARAEGRRRA